MTIITKNQVFFSKNNTNFHIETLKLLPLSIIRTLSSLPFIINSNSSSSIQKYNFLTNFIIPNSINRIYIKSHLNSLLILNNSNTNYLTINSISKFNVIINQQRSFSYYKSHPHFVLKNHINYQPNIISVNSCYSHLKNLCSPPIFSFNSNENLNLKRFSFKYLDFLSQNYTADKLFYKFVSIGKRTWKLSFLTNRLNNLFFINKNYFNYELLNILLRTSTPPPKGFEKFYPGNDDNSSSDSENKQQPKNEKKKNDNNDNNNKFIDLQKLIILCIAFFFILSILDSMRSYKEVTFQQFLSEYVARGFVEKVQVINKEICRAFLHKDLILRHNQNLLANKIQNTRFNQDIDNYKDDYLFQDDSSSYGYNPVSSNASQNVLHEKVAFRIGSLENFEEKFEEFQKNLGISLNDYIPILYTQEFSILDEIKGFIPSILFFLLFLILIQRLQSRGGNQVDRFFKMGKANPISSKDLKSKVKFSDVAGMREAKLEIVEFVDFLKNPKKYEHLGAKIPKGALLCGPPGTGKTLLAKAVAGEANVPFFSMSGSDFIEVFVGVGPSRVRDLFSQARKHAPSIIFIDEIDAVGRKRARGGFAGGANDERENTLNQMLVEMDGFTSTSGVVVLAGTNRSDILDPALTRPGRFDRTVNIERPDVEEREAIFKIHLKPIKLVAGLSVDEVSKRLSALTPGFAGAEISNVCNEAAINAARRGNIDGVDDCDFERAAERVMGGLPKTYTLMSVEQRRIIAYHEAGHAIAGWYLEHADPVLKVSIVPRTNGSLGFSQQMPDDIMLFSKESLLDRMCVVLGGRAAEELFIGSITTGASDDLEKVTKLAYCFVSQWGMNSNIGLVSYQTREKDDPQLYRPFADSTAELIDKEVRQLIKEQFDKVKTLLLDREQELRKLSQLLFSKETISYTDIVNCIGERPFEIKEQYKLYVAACPKAVPSVVESDEKKKEIPGDIENNDVADVKNCVAKKEPDV